MLFEDLYLEYEVLDGLEAMNFYETTPVQEATIPLLLEGRDMLACAQTGTGKTAAYLLPLINNLSRGIYPADKVNAVIMVPTRELAVQIEQQVQGFSYFLPISSVSIYGGTDGITFAQQQRGLEMGADIVIATPGRLIDLMRLSKASLSEVSYFVLDEADRMLDMGFHDDIMQIHKLLPDSCQTVMFSATMPPKIKTLAKGILRNPVEVEIALSRPPEAIRQLAYICHRAQKDGIILDLFKKNPPHRTIIFTSTKLQAKELSRSLRQWRINVAEMHSDLKQEERNQVMLDFKSGKIDVLVATDIVARGIDIDNIELVINYDIPNDPEDYVHRIGRTARGNNDAGTAITLVGGREQFDFGRIEAFLGKAVEKCPVPAVLGEAPVYDPNRKPQTEARRGGKPNKNRQRTHKGRSRGEQMNSKKVSPSSQPQEQRDKRRSNYRHSRRPSNKAQE